MAFRHLDAAPKAEDFTPLQEHQEQTPSTFFGSKPVLYARYSDLTLAIPSASLQADPVAGFSAVNDVDAGHSLAGHVEIWVTSNELILFQTGATSQPTGVSIPYPSIALHATMKYKSSTEALYMNISLNDTETVNEDDDIQILELTILPPNYDPDSPNRDTSADASCIQDIFQAMNTCSDLHPDPDDDSEGDGENDETAPGATGWITADNMDEYLDENGNLRGQVFGAEAGETGVILGPGAGTVRPREEDGEHANGVNGVDGETKWQRTD